MSLSCCNGSFGFELCSVEHLGIGLCSVKHLGIELCSVKHLFKHYEDPVSGMSVLVVLAFLGGGRLISCRPCTMPYGARW